MILFDRWGTQLGTLSGVTRAEHAEELNGEDSLTVETDTPVAKGQRIVWCDTDGTWREHTVSSVAQSHEDDGPVRYKAECENSISELFGDWLDDKRPENATASQALAIALEPSRWQVGTVTVAGAHSTNFYRESSREAVQKVLETWGGELSTTIAIDGASVSSRKVNLTRRGADNGKRFAYRKDMAEIARTFDPDDVCTALYGFGKGVESGDGYGRGLDFASVNGGKQYVEDAEALEQWGRPDGNGGKAHVFGKVEFSDCEDPEELLRLTEEEFGRRKVPKVSYEAKVSVFASYGYDFEGVSIGDGVALIDRAFSPELRVKGRVTRLVRDLLDDGKPTDITIGNIVANAADMMADQYASLQSLSKRATAWDVAAYTPSAYINQIMDGLNREFDAGASYIYQSPEQGIIVGSVPLDPETGKPTRTPASAIQLKGGGFRIANKLKGNGEFDWRTFGTGDGFVADEIVAGMLRGANSHFNLGDGSAKFSGKVGSSSYTLDLSATGGIDISVDGETVGGIQIVDGKATFVASRLKSPKIAPYLVCGQLEDSGVTAVEFMANATNTNSGGITPNFGIEPIYNNADTDPQRRMAGYARFCGRQVHEIVQNSNGGEAYIVGFRGSDSTKPGLKVEPPYFYANERGMGMYWKPDYRMWINGSGFYADVGGKGFKFEHGAFSPDVIYEPETASASLLSVEDGDMTIPPEPKEVH